MGARLDDLKARLAARGLSPRKAFGQNFLIDPNFAAAVARDAAPDERTLCLEAGPGTGVLTRALLDAHPRARVLAVEIDRGLAGLLRDELAAETRAGRFTLLEGDALDGKHGLNAAWCAEARRISRAEERPRRILCANLPYNAATPILANLARLEEPLVERAVATVQAELAARLFGAPGTPDYGPLAAFLGLRASGTILRRAGPELFWPRPKVSSAVLDLRLPPWSETPLAVGEAEGFTAFLRRLFQQRRKTLRAALKNSGLAASDPRSTLRAEDLAPRELLELYRSLPRT